MSERLIEGLAGEGSGPLAGVALDDLNATLLAWPAGHVIQAHVNAELDVVTVVIAGAGRAVVDGTEFNLAAGSILVLPKGAERQIESLSDDFRYLNVHRRRPGLQPNMVRPG